MDITICKFKGEVMVENSEGAYVTYPKRKINNQDPSSFFFLISNKPISNERAIFLLKSCFISCRNHCQTINLEQKGETIMLKLNNR
jgi:hypothetical protein